MDETHDRNPEAKNVEVVEYSADPWIGYSDSSRMGDLTGGAL